METQNESTGWSSPLPFSATRFWNLSSGDGLKTVALRWRDAAGNSSTAVSAQIQLDTVAPIVPAPSLSSAAFSPNSDGRLDSLTITAQIQENNPLSWTITIYGSSEEPLRTTTGVGTTVNWQWDGRTISNTIAADGQYRIVLRATDAAGNHHENAALVVIDTVAPYLVLTHPRRGDIWRAEDQLVVNQQTLTLAGNAEAADDTITVQRADTAAQPAPLSGLEHHFAASVPLLLGENSIAVTAEDPAGNRTTLTRTVLYDSNAPRLTAYGPTAPLTTTQPLIWGRFALDGAAVDPDSSRFFAPGAVDITAATVITPGGFRYHPASPLAEGLNTFRLLASDVAGKLNDFSWTFLVDRQTNVTIRQPLDGAQLNRTTQQVGGVGEPGATVTLALNGVTLATATVDPTGIYTVATQLPVTDTPVVLVVSAVDALGNRAWATATVTVDLSGAAAGLNALPNPFAAETHFALSASAPLSSSIAGWSLLVAGEVITHGIGLPPLSYSWAGTLPNGALADGVWPTTLVVTDTNNSVTTVNGPLLRRDRIPPAAPVIHYPATGYNTIEPSTLVTGTAEPNAVVTLYNSGLFTFTALSDSNGHWSLPLPLAGGVNTLSAIATDRAGLESAPSAPVNVRVVVNPPLIDVDVRPAMVGSNTNMTLLAESRGDNHPDGPPTIRVDVRTTDDLTVALAEEEPGLIDLWRTTWPVPPIFDHGPHVLTFEGEDEVGLIGRGKSAIFVDAIAPRAPIIRHPAQAGIVNSTNFPLVGEAEALMQIQVTIETATGAATFATQANAQGQWRLSIPLQEGPNRITASAMDLVGNRSLASLPVPLARDTVPPVLTGWAVNSPTQTGPDLFLRALITDSSPLALALVQVADSTTQALLDFGLYWQRVRLGDLPEGRYPLHFQAQDVAGNRGHATNMLLVDNTAPALQITYAVPPTGYARIVSDTLYVGPVATVLTATVITTDTLAGLDELRFGAVPAVAAAETQKLMGAQSVQRQRVYALAAAQPLGETLLVSVTDRAANQTEWPQLTLLRDTIPPTVPRFYLERTGVYLFQPDNHIVRYGPQATGIFTVNITVQDVGIGVDQVIFPDLGGSNGAQYSYQGSQEQHTLIHSYALNGQAPISGTFAVTVTDWVLNQTVVTFTLDFDSSPPQIYGEAQPAFVQFGHDLTFRALITDESPIATADLLIDDGTANLLYHSLQDNNNIWQATRPGDLPTDHAYPLTFGATDLVGNRGVVTALLIVADTDPLVSVSLASGSPNTYVPPILPATTDAMPLVYYGAGSGSFTATVSAATPWAGLSTITLGNATSAGADYRQPGALTGTVAHRYQFGPESTFDSRTNAAVTVTALDRAGNQSSRGIMVMRDVAPSAISYLAQQQGLQLALSWQITDTLAGMASCMVTLSQGDQLLATAKECDDHLSYPGANDRPYQLTVVAVDLVGNRAERTATITLTGITTYYPADNGRAALRQGDTILYLHGDHLGSMSLVTDDNGEVVHVQRYLPYGAVRE